MRAVWIIFRRELAQYFTSRSAYLLAAALLALTGFLFYNDLVASVSVKPAEPALIPGFLSFAMIFFAPLLTMRLLAEEQSEGTLDLLLTAPVPESALVFGKFLAVWVYYSALLAVTLVYQVILLSVTRPDFGHTIASYIGIWLYGGATLAVGLLFSALTGHQVVAAFLSMTALLFLWLGDLVGQVVASVDAARVVRDLTLQGHFSTSFAYGLLRMEDVAYYGGVIVVALLIAVKALEARRW